MNTTVKIELLGKENYDTWKLQAQAILVKNDLWEFVNGTKRRPKIVKDDESSLEAAQKWDISDQKAKADLILSISPLELREIKDCETSNEIWLKLASIYESKGPARKATLLKRLILSKMNDEQNLNDFLREFFNCVDKLKAMDLEIADDLLSILLLYAIPDSYESFRVAIESRDELPKPEVLKIKLLEECEARKNREPKHDDAMFARGKCQSKNSQRAIENPHRKDNVKPFKYKCHRCGKVGHMAKHCRSNPAPQSQQRRRNTQMTHQDCYPDKTSEISLCIGGRSNLKWCLDSGASSHMCSNKEMFLSMKNMKRTLSLANNKSTEIMGTGTANLEIPGSDGTRSVKLHDTLYVPDLRSNLLSVAKITENGFQVTFQENAAIIANQNLGTVMVAHKENGLYYVESPTFIAATAESKVPTLMEWHRRLGHLNERSLLELTRHEKVFGMKVGKEKLPVCEICIKGKQTQSPFPKNQAKRRCRPLELIHTDICGPMRQNSIGGSKYFVTFIDDYSRWCEIYFLKNRNEVLDAFMDFKSHAENQTGNKIKTLRSDNATEYCSENFQKFLRVNGIRHETSVQYTPQQNGVAERKNRTLLDMARCMLLESKLSLNFWAEAISTACYIRNRCPSKSLNGEIPLTLWNGRKLTLNYFRTFGEKAYVLDKSPGKGKFSTRSKECIFIGYSTESKAYRLWCPAERKVLRSRDVKFTGKFGNDETLHQPTAQNQEWPANDTCEKETETLELQLTTNESNDTHQSGGTLVQNEAEQVTETRKMKVLPGRPRLVRSGRRGRPKKVYRKEEVQPVTCENVASIAEMNDPKSVTEALSCRESKEWLEAMKREYEALVKNNTWEIVNRPQRQKVIACQWVYNTKFNADGSIKQRKARLVAKGFLQRPNIDFHETYAPVARLSSIRTILAISANYGLIAHQLDFVSAYLNGEIEEEIYMEIPEKLDEVLKCSKVKQNLDGKVCRIRKALYGLKQSGRQWYRKLDEKLSQYGLKATSGDPCVYFERRGRELTIAAIYVDDVIIASNNNARLDELKKALAKSFEMKDMGPIHYCLGIEIKQNANGDIEMSQRKYIMDILERFRMMDSKTVETPIDASNKLSAEMCPRTETEKAEMQNTPYRSLVGSLMYLSVSTRPDIAFAVSLLSQFNENYGSQHWTAAKRVLRYLKKTASYGLRFQRNSGALMGFSDADWGGNSDDRRSYTGYVFKFGNAAISWESRKQRTVALSSTEAEYMALSEACKEAIHLKQMIREITGLCKSVVLQSDNQSALKLARNPVFHARTKHIDIRYHFIREAAERKDVELRYLPTGQMVADVLTKGLFKPKHGKCISEMGLENLCGKSPKQFNNVGEVLGHIVD
ncbi:Retrovirus-related Pol polyprotein from transposon TNT 1-94 [Trichinella sp. T9]|nr:Retrovirus-related Pol polyprotein from transposon TNT 1-94 [Trichinella sp. T9]